MRRYSVLHRSLAYMSCSICLCGQVTTHDALCYLGKTEDILNVFEDDIKSRNDMGNGGRNTDGTKLTARSPTGEPREVR